MAAVITLSPDTVTIVFQHLSVDTLLVAECVCSSWRAIAVQHEWKRRFLALDLDPGARLAVTHNNKGHDWRKLYLAHERCASAWYRGNPKISSYTVIKGIKGLSDPVVDTCDNTVCCEAYDDTSTRGTRDLVFCNRTNFKIKYTIKVEAGLKHSVEAVPGLGHLLYRSDDKCHDVWGKADALDRIGVPPNSTAPAHGTVNNEHFRFLCTLERATNLSGAGFHVDDVHGRPELIYARISATAEQPQTGSIWDQIDPHKDEAPTSTTEPGMLTIVSLSKPNQAPIKIPSPIPRTLRSGNVSTTINGKDPLVDDNYVFMGELSTVHAFSRTRGYLFPLLNSCPLVGAIYELLPRVTSLPLASSTRANVNPLNVMHPRYHGVRMSSLVSPMGMFSPPGMMFDYLHLVGNSLVIGTDAGGVLVLPQYHAVLSVTVNLPQHEQASYLSSRMFVVDPDRDGFHWGEEDPPFAEDYDLITHGSRFAICMRTAVVVIDLNHVPSSLPVNALGVTILRLGIKRNMSPACMTFAMDDRAVYETLKRVRVMAFDKHK